MECGDIIYIRYTYVAECLCDRVNIILFVMCSVAAVYDYLVINNMRFVLAICSNLHPVMNILIKLCTHINPLITLANKIKWAFQYTETSRAYIISFFSMDLVCAYLDFFAFIKCQIPSLHNKSPQLWQMGILILVSITCKSPINGFRKTIKHISLD